MKSRKKNRRKRAKRARVKTYARPSAKTQASVPLSTQQQPAEATQSPQKARTISTGIIPGQFAGSRPALHLAARPTQAEPNPYFEDLWSSPTEQNEQKGPAAMPNPEETPEGRASTVQEKPAEHRVTVEASENRHRGGRPRKDMERNMVRNKKDAGKPWKEIATEMNKETGQNKTAESYRALLKSHPERATRPGENVQN